MARRDASSIAGPTIAEVLKEFLAEQRHRLAARTFARYEYVVQLLERSLNGFGHQSLDKADAARFERLFDATGAEHREFCDVFGPGQILPNVGEFLGYFMVRKVVAGAETLRAAGTVTKKLASWLAKKGYAKAEDAGEAAERGRDAARDLPKAEKLASLLRAFADGRERGRQGDEIEDHFRLTRLGPGTIWVEAMVDGRELGPIKISEEIRRRCRVGWTISGVVGRAGRTWRLVEAWNVYPE